MPEFIDLRLRVRKERLGDLVISLPQYAQPLGFDVVREMKLDPPKLLPSPKPKTKATKQQKAILTAIQKGAVDTASIQAHTRNRSVKRALSNLIKKNLIKGTEGSFSLT